MDSKPTHNEAGSHYQTQATTLERGHKPRCCKVQIGFLVVAVVVFIIVVVVFGVPNSLLL